MLGPECFAMGLKLGWATRAPNLASVSYLVSVSNMIPKYRIVSQRYSCRLLTAARAMWHTYVRSLMEGVLQAANLAHSPLRSCSKLSSPGTSSSRNWARSTHMDAHGLNHGGSDARAVPVGGSGPQRATESQCAPPPAPHTKQASLAAGGSHAR